MTPLLAQTHYIARWPDGREAIELMADDEHTARVMLSQRFGPEDAKAAWIDQDRRKFLGGSDIGSVMNLQPKGWRTPLELYEDKIQERSDEPPDPDRAKFFRRRKRQEPVILELLEEELGVQPVAVNRRYRDVEHDFLRCEVDFECAVTAPLQERFPALRALPAGTLINGESKTVTPFKQHEWGDDTDAVPIHYAAQSMFGLALTGRPATLIVALIGVDDLLPYVLPRDDETCEAVRQRGIDFWRNHVEARFPPAPTNMDDMALLLSRYNGKPVEANERVMEAVAKLKQIKADIKAHELEAESVEFEIAEYIRAAWFATDESAELDDAVMHYGGLPVLTWKKQRRTDLDVKALKALYPDICKDFMREKWFRSMRVK